MKEKRSSWWNSLKSHKLCRECRVPLKGGQADGVGKMQAGNRSLLWALEIGKNRLQGKQLEAPRKKSSQLRVPQSYLSGGSTTVGDVEDSPARAGTVMKPERSHGWHGVWPTAEPGSDSGSMLCSLWCLAECLTGREGERERGKDGFCSS